MCVSPDEISLDCDGFQMSHVAPYPRLESLTRENVSAVEECIDPSQPSTGRSEWSVDSIGQDEVQQPCTIICCMQ